MQANSEISVLHLTNDRPNCSGLLLLSTVFVFCWAYYMRVVYLFGGKLLLTFFVQRFLFVSRFLRFLTFFILGERFFHLCCKQTDRTQTDRQTSV